MLSRLMDKLLLKSEEAAEVLGISRTHFYKLCSAGVIGTRPLKLGDCSVSRRGVVIVQEPAQCWQLYAGIDHAHIKVSYLAEPGCLFPLELN